LELIDRLESASGYSVWRDPTPFPRARDCFTCDPEVMKFVLEQMCIESGVVIRLYTRVVIRLVATAQNIGVRDGRRIHRRYTVTKDDLLAGSRHDDAVCRATFPVDVHSESGFGNEGIRSQPYDIPLCTLIAKDVDGLRLAGRCISGDFLAHSSHRMIGNAVAMGEAAGVVAGQADLIQKLPHEVKWPR